MVLAARAVRDIVDDYDVRAGRGDVRMGRVQSVGVGTRLILVWSAMKHLTCITLDPQVTGGKACIRGLRVTAGTVVGLLAASRTHAEILHAYPYLEPEDIDQALAYAAWRLEEHELPLALS